MKEITQSTLKKVDNFFDASQEKEGILFIFDANQEGEFIIQEFAAKDKIKVKNTPTHSLEDIKFSTRDYNSGESVLTCSDFDIKLKKLENSHFWNSDSFMKIYGESSLKIGE